ncbi:hypothetical protein LKMONMHP_4527 [Methylobacterium organophilum]|uniref:Glycosyltransferase 61 catalytic domain-containing protein n=2 Tax=Methylobacterium organophilum TaxID=410 RepID=A0ABQ4TDH5_METOR|nr:hypothetical protein LKMONMHP_4527 [Methylobacterium organophilum]
MPFGIKSPPYKRTIPLIYGPRAEWMKDIISQKIDEEVKAPDFDIIKFKNATIHGPGVVTLSDKILVQETLQNCEHDKTLGNIHRVESANGFELNHNNIVKRLDGNFIHIKVQWDGNYGHWLIECLPRLILLSKSISIQGFKIIVSGNGGKIDQVYVDSLATIGIAPEDIFFSQYNNYYFDEVIYPSPITIQPWIKSPLSVVALDELCASIIAESTEKPIAYSSKIFIERPNTSRRSLLNIEIIQDIASKNGFAIVNPSKMSFHQQVLTFANAEAVVGVLGAECTNIVFSKPGVKFFGLSPENMQDDFFWDLVSLKKGQYISLHGLSNDENNDMNSSFSIDANIFEQLLEKFFRADQTS